MSASRCLENGYGFCITKAVLLAALLRVRAIPARLGYADVRNHLTSERLRRTGGGRRHMEYVRDRGTDPDVPRAAMFKAWAEVYPPDAQWLGANANADF